MQISSGYSSMYQYQLTNNSIQRQLPSQESSEAFSLEEISQSIVENLDSDSDGQLSAEEGSFSEDAMLLLDLNNDGYVSAEELAEGSSQNEKALQAPPPPPPPPQMKNNEDNEEDETFESLSAEDMTQALIDQLDSDSDGLLNLEEGNFTEETLSLLDSDEDGNVSAQELAENISQSQENSPAPFPSQPPIMINLMQQENWRMSEEGINTQIQSMSGSTTPAKALSLYKAAMTAQ